MKKSVFKDFIREIKGSLGRFFAIMAIVAIGVAFFAGITASSNDMYPVKALISAFLYYNQVHP
jgi:putative ABC transport system permease protein